MPDDPYHSPPDDPYRPVPKVSAADAELARLAEQGRQRIRGDVTGEQAAAGAASLKNLRVAIGGHYGTPLQRWIVVGGVVSLVAAVPLFSIAPEVVGPLAIPMLICLLVARLVVPPTATDRQVATERAWVSALPFALEGYFEALEATPDYETRLGLLLSWTGAGSDAETVQGVFGLIDTAARVTADSHGLHILTGPISGSTGMKVNGEYIHRNHRIVTYVHTMVDKALLPIQRSHAVERVRLTRA